MKFRLRSLVPRKSDEHEVEAENAVEAVQSYHDQVLGREGSLRYFQSADNHVLFDVDFALIEVVGEPEPYISRIFHSGLYRRGGVRRHVSPELRLREIAQKLGWKKDPAELLASGWDGEEDNWH